MQNQFQLPLRHGPAKSLVNTRLTLTRLVNTSDKAKGVVNGKDPRTGCDPLTHTHTHAGAINKRNRCCL